jgi:hypothetical protein
MAAFPNQVGPARGKLQCHRTTTKRATDVVHAVRANKDQRLGCFHRPRGGVTQGVGSIQEIVVPLPPAGDRGRVERSQDPSPGRMPVDPSRSADEQDSRCRAGLVYQGRKDIGVNACPGDGVGAPGTRVLKQQPAARRRRRTGQRVRSYARCVRAPERRPWFTHSAMAKPASSRRRARSRPTSPAAATPLDSSAFSLPTSSSVTSRSPARLRTRMPDRP